MSSNGPSASASAEPYDQHPTRLGQALKDGRYVVQRKLGAGIYSSTWLVTDSQAEYSEVYTSRYCAAKILTLDGTREHQTGRSRELEFLQQIAACEDIEALPILSDHFEERGPGGSHLCFVMGLLGSDLSSFRRSAPKKALPVHVVKNVLLRVLEGLAQLHALDIIHTDLKLDNILFNSVGSDKLVQEELARNPGPINAETDTTDAQQSAILSQPLPHRFKWDVSPTDADRMNFTIIDLGQAQRAGEQPTADEFSAYSLRAPELLLRSDFGPKIDIWALGCLTFEMLTGHWLFAPEAGEDWTLEDDHLAKMLELTGERFSPAMLARAQFASRYLDEHGNLLKLELIPGQSIEAALVAYKTMPEAEVSGAAGFIRACLRLDSQERASAKELELHAWLRSSFRS